jgi:hypothetical protein
VATAPADEVLQLGANVGVVVGDEDGEARGSPWRAACDYHGENSGISSGSAETVPPRTGVTS